MEKKFRTIKVVSKIREHGKSEIETREDLMVISENDNLDLLIYSKYGSWYNIIEYQFEGVEIFVSELYAFERTAEFLLNQKNYNNSVL